MDETALLIEKILDRVRAGAHPSTAAQAEGIAPEAWERMVRDDHALASRAAQAEAEAEQALIAQALTGETPDDRKSAQWVLERRWPDRWAKRAGRPPAEPREDDNRPGAAVVQLINRARANRQGG